MDDPNGGEQAMSMCTIFQTSLGWAVVADRVLLQQ